jgi:hypothetical protein
MARRPGQGEVVTAAERKARRERRRQHSGEWRSDTDFQSQHGLKVTMRRIRGVTDPEVLKVPFRFQCPPLNDFSRPYGFEWARYSTLRLGERARPQGKKLFELSISSLFVDGPAEDDASFVVWRGAPEPQRLIRELRFIMGDAPGGKATPFRLTISQASVWPGEWLVNMPAVLTGLSATEKPGEIGTEYIDVTFLEYPDDAVERRRQPRADEKTRKHRIRLGRDDLYEIAKKHYREPLLWREIARVNGIRGVSPRSESELKRWAKKHKKSVLKIPPRPKASIGVPNVSDREQAFV